MNGEELRRSSTGLRADSAANAPSLWSVTTTVREF